MYSIFDIRARAIKPEGGGGGRGKGEEYRIRKKEKRQPTYWEKIF